MCHRLIDKALHGIIKLYDIEAKIISSIEASKNKELEIVAG